VVTSFFKAVYEESYPVIDPYESDTHTSKINEFGLRPILGLSVFPGKSVSLSTETYLDVLYSKSVFTQENPDATATTKGIHAGLGPLGIVSVNIHF
jgi:hypothetical protein